MNIPLSGKISDRKYIYSVYIVYKGIVKAKGIVMAIGIIKAKGRRAKGRM